MFRNDLVYLFPLGSQSSAQDRAWLAQLFDYVRRQHHQYHYVEVGSYMGGTLTPALLDERCVKVLSIDLRPKIQQDSRNACFDYSQVSTAAMLAALRAVPSLDLAKLTTFDGPASASDYANLQYHLAFIDAEHTDEAVFADFVSLYDHLEKQAVCAFHDTNLITSGMDNIGAFLRYQRREHKFVALQGSSVSAIFLDHADPAALAPFLANACDWRDYKNKSQDELLRESIRNRCTFTFTLKDKPVFPV